VDRAAARDALVKTVAAFAKRCKYGLESSPARRRLHREHRETRGGSPLRFSARPSHPPDPERTRQRARSIRPNRLSAAIRLLRLIPPGTRGKTRVARWLLRGHRADGDVEIRDRFGLRFSVPSLAEPIAFHLLIDGVYEPEVVSFLLDYLQPSGVFVDVGASIGALTIPVAGALVPPGRAVAIEASGRIFDYLQRNVAANALRNVHCINCAATDIEGEVEFYEAPVDHFGMGSMGAQFHATPSMVRGETLDHMLAEAGVARVDLLKIDVEGFEVGVLSGAKQLLLGEHPPLVLFEFIDWAEARLPCGKPGDAQRLLLDWGFKIWRLADFSRGRRELSDVVTAGGEMLVATRCQTPALSGLRRSSVDR